MTHNPRLGKHIDHKKALLSLTDALYGGIERPSDDDQMWAPKVLRNIADWLDKVDDATDAIMAEGGSEHRVGRSVQADLRDIAEGMDD